MSNITRITGSSRRIARGAPHRARGIRCVRNLYFCSSQRGKDARESRVAAEGPFAC